MQRNSCSSRRKNRLAAAIVRSWCTKWIVSMPSNSSTSSDWVPLHNNSISLPLKNRFVESVSLSARWRAIRRPEAIRHSASLATLMMDGAAARYTYRGDTKQGTTGQFGVPKRTVQSKKSVVVSFRDAAATVHSLVVVWPSITMCVIISTWSVLCVWLIALYWTVGGQTISSQPPLTVFPASRVLCETKKICVKQLVVGYLWKKTGECL